MLQGAPLIHRGTQKQELDNIVNILMHTLKKTESPSSPCQPYLNSTTTSPSPLSVASQVVPNSTLEPVVPPIIDPIPTFIVEILNNYAFCIHSLTKCSLESRKSKFHC